LRWCDGGHLMEVFVTTILMGGAARWTLCRAIAQQPVLAAAATVLALWRLSLLPRKFGHFAPVAPSLCQARELYLVAAVIFSMSALLSFFVWYHLNQVKLCREGVLTTWLKRLREGIYISIGINLFSAALYTHYYVSDWSYFTGIVDSEARLVGRYILWSMSLPLQWLIFIDVFSSTATEEAQNVQLLVTAFAVPVLGEWAAEAASSGMHGTSYLAGGLSMGCMVVAYRFACAIPLEPGIRNAACRIRDCMLFLQVVVYPIVHFGRQFGLLSPWAEQVLLYTVLDVCSKAVTHSAICFAQVQRMVFYCVQEAGLQQEGEEPGAQQERKEPGGTRGMIVTTSVDSWRVLARFQSSSPNSQATFLESIFRQPPLESGGLIGMSIEELLPDPSQLAALREALPPDDAKAVLGTKKHIRIMQTMECQSHATFCCTLGCLLRTNHMLEIRLVMSATAGKTD